MALRLVGLGATLLALVGCERLPAGQFHGEVIWEHEFGLDEQMGLARASDGDVFVVADGEVSRLAPSGDLRWSVDGDYYRGIVVDADDDIELGRDSGEDGSIAIERLDGADGSPVRLVELATPSVYGFVLLPELAALIGRRRRQDPETGEMLPGRVTFVELYDRAGALVSLIEFTGNPSVRIERDPRGGFVIAGWEVDGNINFGLGRVAPGETDVVVIAHFDDQGSPLSHHLAPELPYGGVFFIGDDGALYTGGGAYPGDPWGILTRFDETGAIEWRLGIHGDDADYAATHAAGSDGGVVYAAGHLEGTPGFGLLPDPAASGTEALPADQQSFLVSIDAVTGAVRWQRGLNDPVSPDVPLIADAARGLYLVEGRWREREDGSGGGLHSVLVARED